MKTHYTLLFTISLMALSACGGHMQSTAASGQQGANVGGTPPSVLPPNGGSSSHGVTGAVTPVPSFPDDAQTLDQAWSRSDTMIVIDAYEGNAIDWTQMAGDPRVSGVIHRASIGLTVDSLYQSRQVVAEQNGYLWGAYHLGMAGDPIAQAKFYLQTVGDTSKVLLALDLEDTSNATYMNIAAAEQFMTYIFQQTGRVPVVYANQNVTLALTAGVSSTSIIREARLWYARFRTSVPDFPVGIWPSYFLWQFSSEINCTATGSCLYNVPGTQYDIDVNVYYGSKASLQSYWAL